MSHSNGDASIQMPQDHLQTQTGVDETIELPSLTQLAVQHLEKIRKGRLSSEVRDKTVLCLLDYLGALVSGLSAPWATSLLRYAQVSSGGGGGGSPGPGTSSQSGSNVMGLATRCSAETAAFTNASIAHSIIRDDMHLAAGAHIGVMVIPSALALAQRDHWSGEQLLKAVVGGYEMAVALGSAVRHSGTCNPHFRPSGIVGAFAGASTGIVADPTITSAQAAHALGLAANMAAGLNEWPWAGGVEMTTQMGAAARAGITSYDLAKAGMGSSLSVLEGKDGLFAAYGCGDRDVAATFFRNWLHAADAESKNDKAAGGGVSYGTGIMGVKFKPVAGCNFIQTPVSVALRMHDSLYVDVHAKAKAKVNFQVNLDLKLNMPVTGMTPIMSTTTNTNTDAIVDVGDIDRVTIVTTSLARAYPGCDHAGPFEKVQQTKMSLQYGVCAGLLFGRVDEWTYLQFSNEDLISLLGKCVLETDAAFDEDLHKRGRQPCRLEVRMKKKGNGAQLVHRDFMADVPWLNDTPGAAVEERFRKEVAAIFDRRAPPDVTNRDVVDDIVLECRRLLENGSSSGTERLFDLLASPPQGLPVPS
ncbi:hypothetical protein PV08_09720 [Exophiala spinifera]|uniref:MmgE/PrpD family protein n=1 Tax=Exophiala spinifera TaxID=91928 RepID=A0A0D2B0H7_9EURO|nr:uncharacterized protein PV08_09720 [Exophiala spinifera]KIW12443.1 hypothetical protein PV08_09720 [Exophiala spinifera]